MITLSFKDSSNLPIDGSSITPDNFAGKSLREIAQIPLWKGNRRQILSDLFVIEGDQREDVNNTNIQISGETARVKRVGEKMTAGEVIIRGNAGMHLGSEMTGGRIIVEGNAGSWAGSMMKGGLIHIKGNVGDYLAAPYRGLGTGMENGTILIDGNAGNEAACFMTGGLIRIRKNVGLFAGIHMKGGILLVEGKASERIGAMMIGGRIILLGQVKNLLPGFIIDGIRPTVRAGEDRFSGPFYVFKGDVTESWNGSLYVSLNNNKHLKYYETKIA